MPDSDPTSKMVDEFEPAPLPPLGPDGFPVLEPAPIGPIPVEPISICMLGPCANYHELETKMDAQEPMDGTRGHVHLMVYRTCYPHPGIEMELPAPIRRCNRWSPTSVDPETRTVVTSATSRPAAFKSNRPAQWAEYEASWNEK